MADGIVFTGDTGIAIDNSLVGTTVYRQRVVIGGDNTSSGFVNPSTVWPTSDAMGLPVRIVGSSGIVLGSVAQSSAWAVNATILTSPIDVQHGSSVFGTMWVQALMSSGLGASTAIIGSLSSGTAQIGTLGPSSANVIGVVAQSSNWNISTGAVVGLTTTSVVGLTTTSIVNLSSALANYITNSTTVPVFLSTGQLINLSSAITNYVTNSTTVPVYLGQSSANVVGIISQSSNWNLSTAALVGLSTAANLILSQTTAGAVGSSAIFVGGGVVATTANTNATQSSGMIQLFQVDRSGAQTVNLEGPRQFIKTSRSVTAANTSFQQIVPAPGANLVADIVKFQVWSTGIADITIVTSSGSTAPAWELPMLSTTLDPFLRNVDFLIPLSQSNSNIAWGVYCTGSAAKIMVQYVVGTS